MSWGGLSTRMNLIFTILVLEFLTEDLKHIHFTLHRIDSAVSSYFVETAANLRKIIDFIENESRCGIVG
jgi:hypothetical protein